MSTIQRREENVHRPATLRSGSWNDPGTCKDAQTDRQHSTRLVEQGLHPSMQGSHQRAQEHQDGLHPVLGGMSGDRRLGQCLQESERVP